MADMSDFDRWAQVEDLLENAVGAAEAGYLDGNEVGEGEYTIWLYGPDADLLSEVVKRTLQTLDLPRECYLMVRRGDVDDDDESEELINLE